MREKILNSVNQQEKRAHEKLAQHYFSKYAKELQVHFNLSDCTLKRIISRASSNLKCENWLQKFFGNIKKGK